MTTTAITYSQKAPKRLSVSKYMRATGQDGSWADAYADAESAWQHHDDAYGLLLLARLALPHRRRVVLVACVVARTVLHYVPDPHRTKVDRHLAVSEQWAFGLATDAQAHEAWNAIWKVRRTLWAADAADAATYAADAAAYAAAAAAYAYAAADAATYARTSNRAWLAHAVRALLPWSRTLRDGDGPALDLALETGRVVVTMGDLDHGGGRIECAWLPLDCDPNTRRVLLDAPAWTETGAGWLYLDPVVDDITKAVERR